MQHASPEPGPARTAFQTAAGSDCTWWACHPRLTGLGAALLSATLFVLAFPTTEIAPLALVALVPLLRVMRTRSRWQRLRLGWLMGFVVELALFRWIPFTMSEMTSLGGGVGWVLCVLYALWHGLRFGVFLLLAEPVRRSVLLRSRTLAPVAVALFYAVIEWLWPALFPWGLGHAVYELPGAQALLAFQGVPLLTFAVALCNTTLADLLGGRPRRVPIGALATLAALLVPALALTPSMSGASLRVAIVQPNYTLAEKKGADLAMRQTLLGRLEAQLKALPRDTFDLVVASEGSFPLWWRLDAEAPTAPPASAEASGPSSRGPAAPAAALRGRDLPFPDNPSLEATRRIQRAIAQGPHSHAILGGLRRDEARQTRNSAVHFAPDGRILGHYDKQTLVPLSEYMPLAEVFPGLADIKGIGSLVAGERPCAFELTGVAGHGGAPVQVTCGICYESLFADATRRDAGEAEVLVNLTIDTWFGASTAPRMHLMTQTSRAAELGIPLLRSALTGITAYVDMRGHVVTALPRDVPGVLAAKVALSGGTTVYRAIGQVFAPLALLLSLCALGDAFVQRRRNFPPGDAS